MREKGRDLLDRHDKLSMNSLPAINEGLPIWEVGEVYVDLKGLKEDLNTIERPVTVKD